MPQLHRRNIVTFYVPEQDPINSGKRYGVVDPSCVFIVVGTDHTADQQDLFPNGAIHSSTLIPNTARIIVY